MDDTPEESGEETYLRMSLRAAEGRKREVNTGYFGIPGTRRECDTTKVHFVIGNEPTCGVKLRPQMQFQFCASGFNQQYVECRRCQAVARKAARLREGA